MNIEKAAPLTRTTLLETIAKLTGYAQIPASLDPTGKSAFALGLTKFAIDKAKEAIDKKLESYYSELLSADDEEYVAPPKGLTLNTLDFSAILEACAKDIEFEKSTLYARLTKSIAAGIVSKASRRHFILSLHQSTSEELEALRLIYISQRHNLIHKNRYGTLHASEILTADFLGEITSICIETFKQKKFIENDRLTKMGTSFVEAIHKKDQLTPESVDYHEWRVKSILLINSSLPSNDIEQITSGLRELKIYCSNQTLQNIKLDDTKYLGKYYGVIFVGDFHDVEYRYQATLKSLTQHNNCAWLGLAGRFFPNTPISTIIHADSIAEYMSKISKHFKLPTHIEIIAD
jgi:hypothetical protein